MLSENYYIQTQLSLLSIELVLAAGDTPKRSGDFESTYKTATGTEITVKRSPDGKFASKGGGSTSSTLSQIAPETNKAIQKVLLGIGDQTLQNSLIIENTQSPSVTEGIKSTKIQDVIKGDKDPFSNAADFLQAKIAEAATAISENKKEIAIGAGVVALKIAATALGTVAGTLTGAVIANTILGLITGKGFTEAIKLGLAQLTPTGAKALLSNPVVGRLSEYKIIKSAIDAIKEQVEKVKLAKEGGQGIKSFGKKEEVVKKLVTEEGLDYEKVLRMITRRKEEPPNPKKAAVIQKEILDLQRDIEEGQIKAVALTEGKSELSDTDITQLFDLAKKEAEIENKIIEKRGELEQTEGRGFSITKRLNELAEIVEKEGKNSPSYKWRINIVKAEFEYGDELNNLDSLGGYEKLLKSMKKTKPALGSYTTPTASDNNTLREVFRKSSSIPSETPKNLHDEIIANAQKEGLNLQNYLNTPINAQVGLNSGRTCAISSLNDKYAYLTEEAAKLDPIAKAVVDMDMFKNKNIDGYINIGDVAVNELALKIQGYNPLASTAEHTREMIWHESGHLLEKKLGKVEESSAFREDRAKEIPSERKVIPPEGPNTGSRKYALGEFYSPYIGLRMKGVGKYTNTDTGTEVLSSGMELLSNPTMAKRAAKADRETILYALAAMNEKAKD